MFNKHELPTEYVIQEFYRYSPSANYKKTQAVYNGKCPICNEGKSYNKKSRLFFIPNKNLIFCHNCQRTWSPIKWISEVSKKQFKEIFEESKNFNHLIIPESIEEDELLFKKTKKQTPLPYNSINLSDPIQTTYYKNNEMVKYVLDYIKQRKLDTAINSVPLYLSLTDFIHKNRLCIPFYNLNNKIDFYQSRVILKNNINDTAKYLSKMDSDKTIFGINKIDRNFEYLFIFEGPIDSMFVKNGVSMAGLSISSLQKKILDDLFLYKKIWVLDNQLDNKEVIKKYNDLIDNNELVFIWPKNAEKFKDLNELCCHFNLNAINPEFLIKNSFSGMSAKMRLIKV